MKIKTGPITGISNSNIHHADLSRSCSRLAHKKNAATRNIKLKGSVLPGPKLDSNAKNNIQKSAQNGIEVAQNPARFMRPAELKKYLNILIGTMIFHNASAFSVT